ncbi:MAG: electron transfer flavoprotein subunit alpha/FixB family protein, partial [Gemmatimonadetes bacterium]|nr:electron transfer flavoprotein subunit alpha/FixB family protein [Gemmatimonadota bacterium]
NTDPSAPIFEAAHFGSTEDMLDVMEVLTEKVREAKGG